MNKLWNDDWSNQVQLHKYIMDLIGNRNSLTLGLIEDDKLIGLSMGSILHGIGICKGGRNEKTIQGHKAW